MTFQPQRCPNRACASYPLGSPFQYRRNGSFVRKCDGRTVPRFVCVMCGRRFSSQTFRVDYRLRHPNLQRLLLGHFVSKVTLRQSSRILGVTRKTVELRLRRFGEHFQRLQGARLEGRTIAGEFLLDEAETFESDRRLKPVTVPVLIERGSRFIVHVEAAPLPARGQLSEARQRRKLETESEEGVRRSGSRNAVKACCERLRAHRPPGASVLLGTDRKETYPRIFKEVFTGMKVFHSRTSSRARRDRANPLFAINHTLAMLRDGLSRLVRRTWAHAKRRARLAQHLWIYVGWRNFIRGVTNRRRHETPAMAIGIEERPWTQTGILGWSAEFPELLKAQ